MESAPPAAAAVVGAQPARGAGEIALRSFQEETAEATRRERNAAAAFDEWLAAVAAGPPH